MKFNRTSNDCNKRYEKDFYAKKVQIVDVSCKDVENESFTISIQDDSKVYNWTFNVPMMKENRKGSVSQLIEEVGHGDIRFLENEYVYIIESDILKNKSSVDITGFRNSDNPFVLLTPSQYEELISIQSDIDELRQERNIFIFFTILPFLMSGILLLSTLLPWWSLNTVVNYIMSLAGVSFPLVLVSTILAILSQIDIWKDAYLPKFEDKNPFLKEQGNTVK